MTRGELLEPGAVEIGIVGVEHALGEGDRLAAEAADLLEALDRGRTASRITARRTSSAVGPVRTKSAMISSSRARHRVGVLARLHVDL